MRTKLRWPLSVVLCVLGCGSEGRDSPNGQGGAMQTGAGGNGSTGGTGAFASSLPRDSTLGGLSDAQFQQLCQESASYYTSLGRALMDGSCRRAAINAALSAMDASDTELRERCQSNYDRCITQPAGTSNLVCDERPEAGCAATVAEYAACLDDSAAALARPLNSLPACQSFSASSLAALGAAGAGGAPPSCVTAAQKCPQLGSL